MRQYNMACCDLPTTVPLDRGAVAQLATIRHTKEAGLLTVSREFHERFLGRLKARLSALRTGPLAE